MRQLLLIEDSLSDAVLFEHMISEEAPDEFHITHLENMEEYRSIDNHSQFDIAMMDMNLPGLTGFEAVKLLQQKASHTPIIILTGDDDEEQGLTAAKMGVQDYLVKGVSNSEVIARAIRYSIQRKHFEEQISYLTRYDQLTGLINSELFTMMSEQMLAHARKENSFLAVLYMDLDNFKDINDAFGHDSGNMLLIEVASRISAIIKESFGSDALFTRLGGDEFAVAIPYHDNDNDYVVAAERINHAISETFTIGNNKILSSISIGVATFPSAGETVESLLKHAEVALYRAKEKGRRNYQLFSPELHEDMSRRFRIISGLREAIDEQQFQLFYHPKIDLRTGEVKGVEALMRWTHPELGFVPPDVFIPLAEDAGLIEEMTQWVLQTACTDFQKNGLEHLDVAVNISAKQLHHDGLSRQLDSIISDTGIAPERLVLELTETAVMQDVKTAMHILGSLKDIGVKLHVDDFGTGYSSLDYLRRFPVDALKIDRSFVMNMIEQPEDVSIVRLVIEMAHELRMQVVAEGVESQPHVNQLMQLKCDQSQGFHYCKPLPLDNFIEWKSNYSSF